MKSALFSLAVSLLIGALSACGGGGGGVPAADATMVVADIEADYGAAAQTEDADADNNNRLRPGLEVAEVPIVVDEYTADDAPTVYVQRLSYARFGMWLLDGTFDDDGDGTDLNNADDGLDIVYRLLDDNRIIGRANLPSSGAARYKTEADFVYKGERFYPHAVNNDGRSAFRVNFGTGGIAMMMIIGFSTQAGLDDLYDGSSALNDGTALDDSSSLLLSFGGNIRDDGAFGGGASGSDGAGFFADLSDSVGTFSGAFFDAADYEASTGGAPAEIGGVFEIPDSNGEVLKGGFLGKR